MLSRRLLSWLFALTLLFGQAAAFAHALTHLHGHDSALPDKVCEVCVAQVQLGTAIPPSVIALTLPPGNNVIASSAAPLRVDLAPHPACARAPPAPSDV
ncbi:hypothetical protein [Thiobacillus sp.]